jgi:hypothetical protein
MSCQFLILQFHFHSSSSNNNQHNHPSFIVDDGCQPKVELVAKDRNVIAATFIHFLLKNIGTVAVANSCIALYGMCRTIFIPSWYLFLIFHVYPHGALYFFMLHGIVSGLLSYLYCYLTTKLYLPLTWISFKL